MNGLYDEFKIALYSVWNRRWLALLVAWGLCLLGWLVVALIPNSYESKARISVEMQSILSDQVGVDARERKKNMDRIQQTLASTINLEKVVRGTALNDSVSSDRELASKVETLRKNIEIKSEKDNLFEITAKSSASNLSDAENAVLARVTVTKPARRSSFLMLSSPRERKSFRKSSRNGFSSRPKISACCRGSGPSANGWRLPAPNWGRSIRSSARQRDRWRP